MPSIEHIVTPDEDCLRADRLVKKISSGLGYALLQKLFRLHKIRVNGRKISPNDRVHSGDGVEIFADLTKIEESNPDFDQKMLDRLKSMIIYENENFLALNKPAGLSVQLGTKVSICVETLIKSYPGFKCHLVHRLDKDTSGVLLIAKNREFARRLTKLFRENRIKKTYLAVVEGKIFESGTIDNFLEKSFSGNEEKMRISNQGKRAVTTYKPLKSMGNNTLLELNPFTGRKHQLRVHCAAVLGAPIIGDRKYNDNFRHGELFLHAHKVFMEDLEIEIIAEMPEHFQKIISST
jgi:23S rRNA pseudouridine955/2504/2580 synthase